METNRLLRSKTVPGIKKITFLLRVVKLLYVMTGFFYLDSGQQMRFYEIPHSVTLKLNSVTAVLWMPNSGVQAQSPWLVSLNERTDFRGLRETEGLNMLQAVHRIASLNQALMNAR